MSVSAERPVALAGFMGSGKTTVGRELARMIGRPFFDTDEWVVQRSGRPVDMFFSGGEVEAFRRLEAAAVADLLQRGPAVIALGGGALLDDGSRALLRERSRLVFLEVPWAQLRLRLELIRDSRPLLRGRSMEAVERLYMDRLPTYAVAAVRVAAVGDPRQVAAEVVRALALETAGD